MREKSWQLVPIWVFYIFNKLIIFGLLNLWFLIALDHLDAFINFITVFPDLHNQTDNKSFLLFSTFDHFWEIPICRSTESWKSNFSGWIQRIDFKVVSFFECTRSWNLKITKPTKMLTNFRYVFPGPLISFMVMI